MQAYFAYPYSLYLFRDMEVERIKKSLTKEGYEVIDPYESVGVGTQPFIAEKDLKLIEESGLVVVYLPFHSSQTAMELMYSYLKGKRIRLLTSLTGPFFEWLKKFQNVEVIHNG